MSHLASCSMNWYVEDIPSVIFIKEEGSAHFLVSNSLGKTDRNDNARIGN